jgi:hypothetical protein
MATIQKRTVFYEQTPGNPIIFSDWARVITPMGAMVEPFVVGNKLVAGQGVSDYVPKDEMSRIDEMIGIDMDKEKSILADDYLHGGHCMPRQGR